MKLEELTKNVKLQLEQKLNIVKTISILNIPKQNLFEKGSLVILLDNKNKALTTEFLKDNGISIEMKNISFSKILIEHILLKDLKLFNSFDFDELYDNDLYIDYMDLGPKEKKEVKEHIKKSEKMLEESSLRFGKLDKSKLTKQLNTQTGLFDIWMQEHGFNIPNKPCLMEAYAEAEKFHDVPLKKRACIAKCFYKISLLKEK